MRATPIPILSDNYAWLLRSERTGDWALVDPAEAGPVVAAVRAAVAAEGGRLETILLTHHHADHVAGTDEVRAQFPGVRVVGARADRRRLPALDEAVAGGDAVVVCGCEGQVFDTPGHTIGHISVFFPAEGDDAPLLLAGDTLFSLGCGRLLEGTAAMMFDSLARLRELPDRTLLACGHEYTLSNARYALSVDPRNAALGRRAEQAARLRDEGRPTLPAILGEEKLANPFLRARDAGELGALRSGKDAFRG